MQRSKSCTLALEPEARCTAVYWGMICVGYAVTIREKFVAGGTTAREAWKNAETVLKDREGD